MLDRRQPHVQQRAELLVRCGLEQLRERVGDLRPLGVEVRDDRLQRSLRAPLEGALRELFAALREAAERVIASVLRARDREAEVGGLEQAQRVAAVSYERRQGVPPRIVDVAARLDVAHPLAAPALAPVRLVGRRAGLRPVAVQAVGADPEPARVPTDERARGGRVREGAGRVSPLCVDPQGHGVDSPASLGEEVAEQVRCQRGRHVPRPRLVGEPRGEA
ncbi:MAG: hypothetical protein VYE22_29355 [Myxococcota bacterium]|nr:hypothetical protein [Myxococcota bacterium]